MALARWATASMTSKFRGGALKTLAFVACRVVSGGAAQGHGILLLGVLGCRGHSSLWKEFVVWGSQVAVNFGSSISESPYNVKNFACPTFLIYTACMSFLRGTTGKINTGAYMWVAPQNSGPTLVPLDISCRNLIYNQKGPLILRTTWTPKVCKITTFLAIIMGLGLLLYILLEFRNTLFGKG